MRRALTQSVPRRGLSHIQGRALRLTPPRGRRRGRGLCCTGALLHGAFPAHRGAVPFSGCVREEGRGP
ncbi:MAG: hypothetical protein DBY17_04990 [Oscillospiraceae bacterium]|nr:MAG: hypothetical protein DBY17_04990 [Oscillospiraceae bacterium]